MDGGHDSVRVAEVPEERRVVSSPNLMVVVRGKRKASASSYVSRSALADQLASVAS
jgi:hypothetical protein